MIALLMAAQVAAGVVGHCGPAPDKPCPEIHRWATQGPCYLNGLWALPNGGSISIPRLCPGDPSPEEQFAASQRQSSRTPTAIITMICVDPHACKTDTIECELDGEVWNPRWVGGQLWCIAADRGRR